MDASQPILHRFDASQDELGYASALRHAFNTDLEACRKWWEIAGHDHLRSARWGRRTVGGLVLVPMKQNFGGGRMSCCGVAGVAVGPESKGRGIARGLMTEALVEMRAAGFAVSALYASTAELYRSVGYGFGGNRVHRKCPITDLPRPATEIEVRPMRDKDLEFVERCAKDRAAQSNGHLERGPYLWRRILEPRGKRATGWILGGHENPEGYAVLHTPKANEGELETLELADWAVNTPEALDALVGLLAGYATIWSDLAWYGGQSDPLFAKLPNHRRKAELSEPWMLRLVDAPKALASRGYAKGLVGTLELHVEDPVLPENDGPFLLRVTGGRGQVEPGGSGALRTDVATLAEMFTGYATPAHLALSGRVQGTPEALEAAGELFRTPAPHLLEFF